MEFIDIDGFFESVSIAIELAGTMVIILGAIYATFVFLKGPAEGERAIIPIFGKILVVPFCLGWSS